MQNKDHTLDIDILTPSGFKPFDAIRLYSHDKYIQILLSDGNTITCSYKHKFIVDNSVLYAEDVTVGLNLGDHRVTLIEKVNEPIDLYDPVNVDDGSIFLHDDNIISHNTFLGTSDCLVDAETLLGLIAKPYLREKDDVKIYAEPLPGHRYVMTVDVCQGRGQDYHTFTIFDCTGTEFIQVAAFRDNMMSPLIFPNLLDKFGKYYNDCLIVIENNDAGQVVCNGLYYDIEYDNMFVESFVKAGGLGVRMTKKVKRLGCSNLKDLMESGRMQIIDKDTIAEIGTFSARGTSYEAQSGCHDDTVMNLVLFAWFVSTSAFGDISEVDLKELLYAEKIAFMEEDILTSQVYHEESVTTGDPYIQLIEDNKAWSIG